MRKITKLTPLGKYITKVLVDREMSKAELAKQVGISPQYLIALSGECVLAKSICRILLKSWNWILKRWRI